MLRTSSRSLRKQASRRERGPTGGGVSLGPSRERRRDAHGSSDEVGEKNPAHTRYFFRRRQGTPSRRCADEFDSARRGRRGEVAQHRLEKGGRGLISISCCRGDLATGMTSRPAATSASRRRASAASPTAGPVGRTSCPNSACRSAIAMTARSGRMPAELAQRFTKPVNTASATASKSGSASSN